MGLAFPAPTLLLKTVGILFVTTLLKEQRGQGGRDRSPFLPNWLATVRELNRDKGSRDFLGTRGQ